VDLTESTARFVCPVAILDLKAHADKILQV